MHFEAKHYQNAMARINGLTPPYQIHGATSALDQLEQNLANSGILPSAGVANLHMSHPPPVPHPVAPAAVDANPEIAMANQILAEETQARLDYLDSTKDYLDKAAVGIPYPVPLGNPVAESLASLNSQVVPLPSPFALSIINLSKRSHSSNSAGDWAHITKSRVPE